MEISIISIENSTMALRDDILESLQIVQESLRDTLKEAAEIRGVAVQEEVHIGVDKVNRKCTTALKYARRLQDLVKETPNIEKRA